jgi:hypothetical protein
MRLRAAAAPLRPRAVDRWAQRWSVYIRANPAFVRGRGRSLVLTSGLFSSFEQSGSVVTQSARDRRARSAA